MSVCVCTNSHTHTQEYFADLKVQFDEMRIAFDRDLHQVFDCVCIDRDFHEVIMRFCFSVCICCAAAIIII